MYKQWKPTDKTILENFNPYRFADYKQKVVKLLQKGYTISIETVKLVQGL